MSLLAFLAAAAVSATTPPPPADDPQEIAEDSARDLKESRFYNRPGATRADYDADWQECRLIARGSRNMSGQTVVVPYNPGIISPAAAAGGGIIGAMIGNAIVEGQLRRANRRSCLMVKGWNLVEVQDPARRAAIAAMTDAEREAHFNQLVGAETLPEGVSVTRWVNGFAAPRLAATPAPRKPADRPAAPKPLKPVGIAEGQGGVILGFRRPDGASQGKSASLLIARYDPAEGNLVTRPRGAKEDKSTYAVILSSRDKALEVEHVVAALTPGTYVIAGAAPGVQGIVNTNFCLGSAMFTVEPGKLTYLGDFIPYPFVELESGETGSAMKWQSNPADAEAAAPARLASGPLPVRPADYRNGAAWGCAATTMAAYEVLGAPRLENAKPPRAGTAPAAPTTIITVPSG